MHLGIKTLKSDNRHIVYSISSLHIWRAHELDILQKGSGLVLKFVVFGNPVSSKTLDFRVSIFSESRMDCESILMRLQYVYTVCSNFFICVKFMVFTKLL